MSDLQSRTPQADETLRQIRSTINFGPPSGGGQAPPAPPTPTLAELGVPEWGNIENSPDFAVMTYRQQQTVRDRWFQRAAPSLAGFSDLTPRQQAIAHQKFVTARPSVVVDDLTERGQQFLLLGEAFAADEATREQARQAWWDVASVNFNETSTFYRGITNFASRMLNNAGLVTDDQLDQMNGDGSTGRVTYTPQTTADQNAFDYMLSAASEDEEVRRRLQRAAVGGTIGGTLFDVGLSVVAASPISAAASRFHQAARAGEAAGRLARLFRHSATAFAVESLAESAFMTAADISREIYNEEVTRYPEVANLALRTGLLFGENFLMDMAFWGLLRTGGNVVKAMSSVYRPSGFRRGVSAAEEAVPVSEGIRAAVRRVDPAMAASLPDELQITNFRRLREDLIRAERMGPEDIGSDEWMRLLAESKGYHITTSDGGAFTLTRDVPRRTGGLKSDNLGTFATTDDAFLRMVDDLDGRIQARPNELGTQQVVGSRQSEVKVTRVVDGTNAERTSKAAIPSSRVWETLQPAADGTLRPADVKAAVRAAEPTSKVFREVEDVVGYRLSADDIVIRKTTNEVGVRVNEVDGRRVMEVSYPDRPLRKDELGGLREEIVRKSFSLNADDLAKLSPDQRKSYTRARKAHEAVALRPAKNLRETLPRWSGKSRNAEDVRNTGDTILDLGLDGKKAFDPRTGATLRQVDRVLYQRSPIGVLYKDGTRKVYANLAELEKVEFPRQWLTEGVARQHLQSEYGLGLRKSDEGFQIVREGRPLRSDRPYATLDELFEANPDLVPRRDISTLRDDVVFDPDAKTITFEDGVIRGQEAEVIDFLERTFKKGGKKTVHTTTVGQVKFDLERTRYLVEMPDIGFKREFSSLENAKKFLEKSRKDYTTMNDIALAAGTEIEFRSGLFRMRLPDDSYAVSRSLEGIRQELGRLTHQTDAVPDLLATAQIPAGYVRQLENRYRRLFGESLGTPKLEKEGELLRHVRENKNFGRGYSKRTMLETFFRPYETMARKIANDLGDDELLRAVYKHPRATFDVFRQKYGVVERGLERLFKTYDQKGRVALLEAFRNPNRSVEGIFEQIGARGAENARETLAEARKVFDVAFEEFGIDGYKFLTDYFPRIQDFFADGRRVDLGMSTADLFRSIPSLKNYRNVAELKFFAENLRVKDLYEMSQAANKGIDELMRDYFRKGLRQKYMKDSYENAKNHVTRLYREGKLDEDTFRFLVSYSEELVGLGSDVARRQIMAGVDDMIQQVSEKLVGKAWSPGTTGRFMQTMRTLTVGAHMAGRPFLPLRNMQQIWTTLAPRLGNDVVAEAIKVLVDNPQTIVKQLINQDVILHGKAAILEMVQASDTGAISRAIESGMLWFRNSDDFNRAVSALASWIPYDDAVKQLRAGTIRADEFLEVARLDRLQPDLQRDIVRLTEIGDHDSAKNILARAWVDQTQFDYISAGNPRMMKGNMVGRTFGMYGHYPVKFRENLILGLGQSYVPMKTRLATAARVAANTLGLYAIFQNVLGINASNFNPGTTMLFSGGPYYTYVNNLLQSFSAGYRGKQFRARIGEETIRMFVPGSSFVYSQQQAQSLMERGYEWEGVLRMMTFPVIDPENLNAR